MKLAIIAMLAVTAWGQQFEDLGRKALHAAQSGRYQEAVAAYEQMLKIDPVNKGVRYDMALALNRLGRNRESLATLGKPSDADSFALAGLNHRALGDLASAERDLRAAFTLQPGPQLAADFGIVLLDREKREEAEKVFRRYSDEVRCLVGLGLAAYSTGRNAEAEKNFAAAAEREPDAADVRAELGDVYFATDRFQDADAAYREAIRLDARSSAYRVKAGRNLLRLDQEAAAQERFREAVHLDPLSSEAHFELGRMAAKAREDQLARSHLEAAAAIDPGRDAAHYQLGLLYRRGGDTALAAASMRRFEQLRKQDQPYRVDMAPPTVVVEGDYRFPAVQRMPGGRLVSFVEGTPKRTLVSSDDGLVWREDSSTLTLAPEPASTRLRDGSLYRVTGAGPIYGSRSTDGGRTWSKPALIAPSGVAPRLLRLGNGMLVLTSGRPGVQLRISKSGLGSDWSEPLDLLPPTSDKPDGDSCGHTGLVALDPDTFLIVYSWFQKPDANGRTGKAVLARRIRLIQRPLSAGP